MGKRFALLAVLAVLTAVPAHATVFERGGPLSAIDTAHCTFVFPEECRADAERLAAMADSVYAEVTAFVGTDPGIRVTVLVSGDSEALSGYTSVQTGDRIVIYRSPALLAGELGSLEDSLVSVFRHELTHAVSLNVKSGFWAFLEAVVGDVVAPNYWWMEGGEFIEGVTVASESASGFGRANDPLVLLAIRQDILEGKARSPQEARGGDDRWPGGALRYWYGGVFTVWLRETYGADRYGALWREFGQGNILTGSDGFLFLPGAFQAVYGRPLEDVWSEFLQAAAYRKPIVSAVRRLREEPGRIVATAARGGDLLWGDTAARTLFLRDGSTGLTRAIASVSPLLSGISARRGSPRILLSEGSWSNAGAAARLAVREWDEASGAFVGPEYPGLREAAWMPEDDGGPSFAAVGVRGSFSDLVLVRGGRRDVLVEGSYDRQIASPAPLGDGKIAFLLREKGTTRVARIDPATRTLEILESERPLGVIRHLSCVDGTLAFSCGTRDDYPLLGLLDPAGLRVEAVALSGGVTFPLAMETGIHYVGRFSDGMRPCLYPEGLPAPALEPAGSRWTVRAGAPPSPTPASAVTAVPPSRPWSSLPSLVPALRFPYPKIGLSGLEGMGLALVAADPAEAWMLTAMVDYDWTRTFADVSLSLQLVPPSSTVLISASDGASWDSVESRNVRTVMGGVGASWYAILAPEPAALSLSLGASLTARAPQSSGADPAYAWPFASLEGSVGAAAAYDGRLRRSLDPAVRPTGLAASLAVDAAAPLETPFLPGAAVQANLAVSLGAVGLNVDAWAAATLPAAPGLATLGLLPAGIYRSGAARSGLAARYPVFREYASFVSPAADSWLYGCFDANWMPLAADTMTNVRDLKVFLTRIAASVGYRGALAGMSYLDAVYFRFHVLGGFDQGAFAASPLGIYGEVSWALRASAAKVPEISFGFGLSAGL